MKTTGQPLQHFGSLLMLCFPLASPICFVKLLCDVCRTGVMPMGFLPSDRQGPLVLLSCQSVVSWRPHHPAPRVLPNCCTSFLEAVCPLFAAQRPPPCPFVLPLCTFNLFFTFYLFLFLRCFLSTPPPLRLSKLPFFVLPHSCFCWSHFPSLEFLL